MARDKDPRYERASENLRQEGEEVVRRKNVNRQATEERKLEIKRRAEDLKGALGKISLDPRARPHMCWGRALLAAKHRQTGPKLAQGRRRERARELDEDGPSVAKTVRRGELEQGDEPVAMEDENEEGDIADATCHVAGKRFPEW